MQVPFVDLKTQYKYLKYEIDSAIGEVLNAANFIKGRQVQEFEKAFAAFCGGKECIAVANGTDAVFLALKALGVGPGDEVITVPNTFIATSEAISLTGAEVVFCDINRNTYTIEPETLEEFITPRTKALVPVHLYGCPCEMERITEIAQKHNLYIVGDSAQAHGAKYNGQDISLYADISTYSFFPGKNLGAYGDAGAVLVNNAKLAARIRMLADHGRREKYEHTIKGTNSRLDTIQAAVLQVKLKYLESWNTARRKAAEMYNRGLNGVKQVKTQYVPDNCESVYHLFVLEAPERDNLKQYLQRKGIATGIHYPISLPFQPAYSHLNCKERFRYVQEIADRLISLPVFPEITAEQVEYVTEHIKEFYR